MKIGAENRKKVIAAGVLGVAAIFLFVNMVVTPSSPPAAAPAPVRASQGPGPVTPPPLRRIIRAPKAKSAPSPDPRLRLDLLKSSEDEKYAGTGRNIFAKEAPPPPPLPKPLEPPRPGQVIGGPPPVAPPPPINLKFFGFANRPGEPKKVFLSQGEDVFIASEGDIVGRRYKVLRISPNAVEIQDVLSNNKQSIPLTAG